nr:site-specific integrase [Mycoplana azooxidifex]
MKAAGVGIPTVRRTVGALKRCFDHARIASLTGDNPAKDISVKAARASGNSRVTPPTKEQYDALVAAADSIRPANTNQPGSLTLRIQFAGRTGLRASELWALRWRNINFKRALVSVSARVDAYAGVEDVTKTQAGERDIDLADELVEALQAWREATAFGADDDFVFPDSKGGTVSHTNFTKREWAKVKKAAGVDIGWHALRHFAISVWIETGFSHKEVQGLAGHSSINVTTTRYGHLFASDDRRARMNKIGL